MQYNRTYPINYVYLSILINQLKQLYLTAKKLGQQCIQKMTELSFDSNQQSVALIKRERKFATLATLLTSIKQTITVLAGTIKRGKYTFVNKLELAIRELADSENALAKNCQGSMAAQTIMA